MRVYCSRCQQSFRPPDNWLCRGCESSESKMIEADNARLREALKEIAKHEGRYSEDPNQHCRNCVEDMVQLAEEALTEAREGGTDEG